MRGAVSESIVRHSSLQVASGLEVRSNPVDSPRGRHLMHFDNDDFGMEVIQIQANRLGKLRVADLLLHRNNVAAALDHVLDDSQVAGIIRIGPNKSLKFYVLECRCEIVALHTDI